MSVGAAHPGKARIVRQLSDNPPMLAYRHAFHAGNHADVLKHLVLTRVLRYMCEKDKPFTLILFETDQNRLKKFPPQP